MTTWIPPGLPERRALGNLMRVWRGSAPYGVERSQEPALWGSGVQATGSLDALEEWMTHHPLHINQSELPLTPIVTDRGHDSEGRHCGVAVTAPEPEGTIAAAHMHCRTALLAQSSRHPAQIVTVVPYPQTRRPSI